MMLSVVLATFNEEENISSCLESIKDIADEIIIVDGGSVDKTVEITRKFGAKVTVTDNPPIFHINKQKAVDLALSDWVLQLDADERVTKELSFEIEQTIQKSAGFDSYFLKRKNFFLGTWLKKGGQYPDPLIRLFKKGKGKFPCQSVHEQIAIDGNVACLENDLLHYTAPTFSRYLINSNRYTTLTAEEYAKENIGIGFFTIVRYMLLKPLLIFLSLYIRHKGIMDGFAGFVFALYSGLHISTSYIKYWEIAKKGPA